MIKLKIRISNNQGKINNEIYRYFIKCEIIILKKIQKYKMEVLNGILFFIDN